MFLTIQDPAEVTVSGFNDKDTVSIFTKHGKQLINPDEYMDVVEAFRPDFYLALCDGDTGPDCSSKRVRKSIERSKKMTERCLVRHNNSQVLKNNGILGAVEGGYCAEARTESVQNLSDKDLSGFVIDGLHTNGAEVGGIKFKTIEEIVKHTIVRIVTETLIIQRDFFVALTDSWITEFTAGG